MLEVLHFGFGNANREGTIVLIQLLGAGWVLIADAPMPQSLHLAVSVAGVVRRSYKNENA